MKKVFTLTLVSLFVFMGTVAFGQGSGGQSSKASSSFDFLSLINGVGANVQELLASEQGKQMAVNAAQIGLNLVADRVNGGGAEFGLGMAQMGLNIARQQQGFDASAFGLQLASQMVQSRVAQNASAQGQANASRGLDKAMFQLQQQRGQGRK